MVTPFPSVLQQSQTQHSPVPLIESGFQLLRLALSLGSLVMLLAGLRLALQPQAIPLREVKSGINQLVEEGDFQMQTARKPVMPGLVLLWGGVLTLSVAVLVTKPLAIAASSSATLPAIASPPAPVPTSSRTVHGNTLADFWQQSVSFPQLAQTLDLSRRVRLLDKAIETHEHGWIDRLLCCPCLMVIARPASGKSSFAAALAMCRELLLPDLKLTIAVDPNANLKSDKGIWQAHWRLVGAGDDWKSIGTEIAAMYRRFADSQGKNFVSSIYDELTAYDGNVNADHLGGLLPQITSKARDSEEYIILVSHNDTLKCLGGQPGEAKLKNDMVQLNLGSKSAARGKLVPTGTGTIDGLDFDERNKPVSAPITLPRWFDPVYLAQLFPEVYRTADRNQEDFSVVSDSSETVVDLLPEPPSNHGSTTDANDGTAAAARVAAARTIQGRCRSDLQVEPQEADILAAMDAVVTGLADSKIIKEVLRLTGSHYQNGKQVLHIIKQTISHPN
ncbi:MAG: hypothetical protein AAFR99_11495 [Cyanobacteria bacterium J06629_9]